MSVLLWVKIWTRPHIAHKSGQFEGFPQVGGKVFPTAFLAVTNRSRDRHNCRFDPDLAAGQCLEWIFKKKCFPQVMHSTVAN